MLFLQRVKQQESYTRNNNDQAHDRLGQPPHDMFFIWYFRVLLTENIAKFQPRAEIIQYKEDHAKRDQNEEKIGSA